MRRITLCADDYGLSPGVSRGIRDLIARGRLNATSVMTAAPSFNQDEADALMRIAGKAAIGLHVTLTAPFRPLFPTFAPLRDGAFPKLPALLGLATARRLNRDTVYREVTAQLQAFARHFGRMPDYVDGHQHVQLFPQIRDAFLRAVIERAPNAWVRQCGRFSGQPRGLADRKALLLDVLSLRFRRKAQRLGVPFNPAFAGTYNFGAAGDFSRLFASFLDGLPDGGLVMCHPGFADDELKRVDPLTTQRECEFAFFAGDDFPRLLAERGFTLG
ncbi:MAG: hypothetical protein OJF62_000676 [Pseudolabrys sp.]|jgi:predicted glycoside hydrolase/deacetylase ChbG (UPF0249 family)|nr:hypothetical protein [Pseudolabrys sp.]